MEPMEGISQGGLEGSPPVELPVLTVVEAQVKDKVVDPASSITPVDKGDNINDQSVQDEASSSEEEEEEEEEDGEIDDDDDEVEEDDSLGNEENSSSVDEDEEIDIDQLLEEGKSVWEVGFWWR